MGSLSHLGVQTSSVEALDDNTGCPCTADGLSPPSHDLRGPRALSRPARKGETARSGLPPTGPRQSFTKTLLGKKRLGRLSTSMSSGLRTAAFRPDCAIHDLWRHPAPVSPGTTTAPSHRECVGRYCRTKTGCAGGLGLSTNERWRSAGGSGCEDVLSMSTGSRSNMSRCSWV